MHTLCWLSRRRSQAIALALTPVSNRWSKAWSVSGLPDAVWQPVGTSMPSWPLSGWSVMAADRAMLGLRMDHGAEAALGRLLANAHDDTVGTLAGRVGRSALHDLARRIFELDETAMPNATDPSGDLPAALREPARGGGSYVLDLGARRLWLAIDAALADRLAPPAPPAPAPLHRRGLTLGDGRVRVHLRLDLGDLPLGQLQQLTAGEVIASRIPLDTAFTLALPHAAPLACARLGRAGEHRAAVVEPLAASTVSPLS